MRYLRAVLKMESVTWSDLTSVSREADASQSSGMRRALRSVTSKRAVFAAVSALARTPVSWAVNSLSAMDGRDRPLKN